MENLLSFLQPLTLMQKAAIAIVIAAFVAMLVIAAGIIAFAITSKRKKRPAVNTFKKPAEILALQDAAQSYLLLISIAVMVIYLATHH
jgi:flagellar basal body-associated protein FliL